MEKKVLITKEIFRNLFYSKLISLQRNLEIPQDVVDEIKAIEADIYEKNEIEHYSGIFLSILVEGAMAVYATRN